MNEPQPHSEAGAKTEKQLAQWREICHSCEVIAMEYPDRVDLDTEMKAARRLVQIGEAIVQAENNGRHSEAKELRAQFTALKKRWEAWG